MLQIFDKQLRVDFTTIDISFYARFLNQFVVVREGQSAMGIHSGHTFENQGDTP